mmetsp:Transcript_41073/g.60291  ORF Transcript_41073/g.60291 Transcript_41073/m.60291 type:complete len:80 (-) Transcript_41073:651-890(-)
MRPGDRGKSLSHPVPTCYVELLTGGFIRSTARFRSCAKITARTSSRSIINIYIVQQKTKFQNSYSSASAVSSCLRISRR